MIDGSLSIDSALERLAGGLMKRMDAILDAYVARTRVEVPEFFASDDPALVDATRESARASLLFAFQALRAGREVPDSAPPAAAEEARVAAEIGIPLETVLKTNDVGHSTAWEHILAEVEGLGLDARARTAVLQITSRYAFAYVEQLAALVTDEYARARKALLRSRDRLRVRLVRDVLEGLPCDAASLGYPLAGWHLAAIAWGERPDRAMAALSEVLRGRLLTVAGPLEALWAWIAIDASDVDQRLDPYVPPPDTRVALGAPGHGRAGFRRSHEQALAARVVALRTPDRVTRWRKVALEALALRDEEGACAFVREELGTLAGRDQRATVLRETLAAWFEANQRSSGAAARLGVHERTVSYRLRAIEERLGHAILERRTELDAALRLHDHCGVPGSSILERRSS
jgi:PucR C-terminal helix-turn-helix domain/GGDEF-like domain